MDLAIAESAERTRSSVERGLRDPRSFRAALLEVAPVSRDAWVDRVLGLGELPEDGPTLPRDCVPYLPCAVDPILRAIEGASIEATDVFVDVGAGVGRAAALVHLLTGASVVGVEVQADLARIARETVSRLGLSRMSIVEGDAVECGDLTPMGSVFFLYCPFSGTRLARWLDGLETITRTRHVRICCVDVPLPERVWLHADPRSWGDLVIHRSAPPRSRP